MLWFEYFRSHAQSSAVRLILWAIIAPIVFNDLMSYYDDMIHYQADMENHLFDDYEQEESGSES